MFATGIINFHMAAFFCAFGIGFCLHIIIVNDANIIFTGKYALYFLVQCNFIIRLRLLGTAE